MGTYYQVTFYAKLWNLTGVLKSKIESRLFDIIQIFSTYIPESQISQFNKMDSSEPFSVSNDFITVMKEAQNIYHLTEGAWDGTIKPLVSLWGFDKNTTLISTPNSLSIDKTLNDVGFNNIIISKNTIQKSYGKMQLDLASIAKGFAVDKLSQLLNDKGYSSHLIDIGGELKSMGLKKDGSPWLVAINYPDSNSSASTIYTSLPLVNTSIATSGDYRKFYEINGQRFQHIIDPRDGYPVSHNVVSVSVVAPSCMQADALATAIMVMGAQKGIQLLSRLDNVEGLIIFKVLDSFQHIQTDGFPKNIN